MLLSEQLTSNLNYSTKILIRSQEESLRQISKADKLLSDYREILIAEFIECHTGQRHLVLSKGNRSQEKQVRTSS